MTNCPGCGFLMGDHEQLCGPCSSETSCSGPRSGADDADQHHRSGAAVVPGVSQAALEAARGSGAAGQAAANDLMGAPPRRVAAPMPDVVVYRGRGHVRAILAVVIVAATLGGGVAYGLDGRGPLADPLVELGLAEAPPVRIPSTWEPIGSSEAGFVAAVPQGVEPLDAPFVGGSAQVGENAAVTAFATDFGLGPDGMAPYRSAEGLRELADRFADLLAFGEQVVYNELVPAEGWAVDTVYVKGEDTTRARFHLARGRLHLLITSGPDSATAVLDEAHRRLLAGFRLD